MSWVEEPSRHKTRIARAALIGCLASGLIQEQVLALAWNVEVTLGEMKGLAQVSAVAELMGGTLILLRQVYAELGQRQVGIVARALARKGQVWSLESMM